MVRHSVQNAIELGAEGVLVRCRACQRRRRIEPKTALRLFGADTLIADIAQKLRCKCGAKNAHAVAAWKERSRGGGDPQPIVPKDWGRLP